MLIYKNLKKGRFLMSENLSRRLPVYLVLDTSGSMYGEPIEAVRQGIKALISDLRNDPQAIETAYLSVITFNTSAQQIQPLTELMDFQEPDLDADGLTSLGEALTTVKNCIENEVRKGSATQKGDWKPLIFLMTDGEPTDSWEHAAKELKNARLGNIIALAAGPDASTAVLKKITEAVLQMNALTPGSMTKFFKWVSASIKLASNSVKQVANPADQQLTLPPPPANSGFTIVM